ncbi:MAG TPA: TlyA family RNA methyltransferase [Opitutaceae bacterium]|nr:TlyA family RNA methyltransferase [Opitutaceae bacterium]
MPSRHRLDELLVSLGLAPTRAQAKALIMAGRVRLGTERLDKPGKEYPADAPITIDQPPRFVGRGGEKLEAALDAFKIDLAGAAVLDVGASTGGFTDCALQRGAAHVTAIDVGRAQMHSKLLADPRVTSIERLNARSLKPSDLPRAEYDAVVVDVSFISLRLILPAVWPYLRAGGTLVALVKPQFEAGKTEASRARGVIRDDSVRDAAISKARNAIVRAGFDVVDEVDSALKGPKGNRERFVLATRRRDA